MAGLGAKNWMFQEEVTSSDVNGYLADQVVMRFADAATRTAAFGGAGEPTLAEGMVSYLDSEKRMEVYNGSEWVAVDVNGSLASQVVFRFADSAARDAAFGGPGELTLVEGMICTLDSNDEVQRYSGTDWVSLNTDSDRNVIINGAMQVAQRSTSVTGITGSGYNTADRWYQGTTTMGTWTQTVENDAPTGSGLRRSLKVLCTTADASPAAGDFIFVRQYLEGQNCQKFKKGTSSAERLTLSFWVKSSTTGTFVAELEDVDGGRWISQSYTVSVADTWEKKTLTYVGDTSTAIDNDNNYGIAVTFWLGAGSTFSGGSSLNTSWGTTTNTRAFGQTNLAGAINRYWQITGVQLESGPVATAFDFEQYGTTLEKCQRYYFRRSAGGTNANFGMGWSTGTTNVNCFYELPTRMRTTPSGIDTGGSHEIQQFSNSTFTITGFTYQSGESSDTRAMVSLAATGMTANSGAVHRANGTTAYIGFTAEL